MLAAESLLHVWERGLRCHPAERSLQLLAFAAPEEDRAGLADVDLPQRDWHLLQLRRQWFGAALAGWADCPACGERMEIELDAAAIAGARPQDGAPFVTRDGRRFRMPTVGDLVAVASVADADAATQQLLERCSLDGPIGGDLQAVAGEVDAGLQAIAEERGIYLHLACTQCGQPSRHAFDPADFLWTEIVTAASALLEEVHTIARAYGWGERDILTMSAQRRNAYLTRITA